MKLKPVISFILLTVLLAISCGKRPSYVLSRDKMTDVMYDLQMANAIVENHNLPAEQRTEEYKNRILAGVLQKHSITQAQLDSSIAWYSDNMDEYRKVNDSNLKRINILLSTLRDEQLALDGYRNASNDMMTKRIFLNDNTPTYSFKLPTHTLDKVGREFFSFQFDVLGADSLSRLEAGIYYTYKDTTVRQTKHIGQDAHYAFTKPNLPDSLLTGVNGYIRLKQSKKSVEKSPVFIYHIRYQDSTSTDAENSLRTRERVIAK